MRPYSTIEFEILKESLYKALNNLWDKARKENKKIRGVSYCPANSIGGSWMKMFSHQYVKGVWFELGILSNEDYMISLSKDSLNVLFINQKVIKTDPKVELIEAKDFNFGRYKFDYKIDYVMVITDDISISLLSTDCKADYLVDRWVFNE